MRLLWHWLKIPFNPEVPLAQSLVWLLTTQNVYVYRSILYILDKAKRLCYRCSKNPPLPEFLGEQNVVGRKLEIPAGYDGYILLLQKGWFSWFSAWGNKLLIFSITQSSQSTVNLLFLSCDVFLGPKCFRENSP